MSYPIVSDFSKRTVRIVGEFWPEASVSAEEVASHWGVPPRTEMGHHCLGCFFLAAKLKNSPKNIAKSLAARWSDKKGVRSVSAEGPYLNFVFTSDYLGESILAPLLRGGIPHPGTPSRPQKIMFEYSQPNTHKTLHVGHMRNLCLGNALTKILAYMGDEVVTATYPGDVGTHVAKCLWYLKKFVKDEEYPEIDKGDWLGEIYTRAVTAYSQENSKGEHGAELTEILKQICRREGEYYSLWRETRQWSINLMKKSYDWAGVDFDHWFWESEVDAPSLAWAQKLHGEGVLVEDQGAVGMDLRDEKLGFCILIKKDGTGLYATKDVELARVKLEKFGVDQNIYLVDNRQSRHFRQVFAILKKLGVDDGDRCRHLEYEMVELPTGPMSSRLGNIIAVSDLIGKMEEKIIRDYLGKYLEGDEPWDSEEMKRTATIVANGAIKYGMVRIDNNRKIIFQMEEWLKLDGETGPYLQYTCARIQSLKRKLGEVGTNPAWNELREDCEVDLIVSLGEFPGVLERCARQFKTMPLCAYLYELAKAFNSFYARCPVGKAETRALGQARLALAEAVGTTLKKGLSLLGISVPERM